VTNSDTAPGEAGPGLLLLAVATALPWLIVPTGQPWPGFHRDGLQALVWLIAAGALLIHIRGPWAVPPTATALTALAALPLLQAALGVYADAGDALLPTLTLAGLAAAVVVAANAQRHAPLLIADALFAGIVIASLASVALALMQWLQIDLLGPLTNAKPLGGRPTANLGQPNLLATLLLWGLVGATWGHWRGQIGRETLLLLGAVLLLGVVMTQSRSGALGVLLLAVFAAFAKRRAGLALPVPGLATIGLGFLLLAIAWPTLNAGLDLDGARAVADTSSAGKRPAIWAAMLEAVGRSPWLGYGWNQGIVAHLAVADDRPPLHVIVQHAHNIGLDLLVWNGAVLGTLLALALLTWYGRRMLRANDPPRWLLMAALSVFGLHAMLELPHTLLVFLVPAALMAGTVEALESLPARWSLPRSAVAVVIVGLTVALVQVGIERQRVLQDLLAHRMIRARIGDPTPPPPPALWLLRPLQQSLVRGHRGVGPKRLATCCRRCAFQCGAGSGAERSAGAGGVAPAAVMRASFASLVRRGTAGLGRDHGDTVSATRSCAVRLRSAEALRLQRTEQRGPQ
jgi:O-antigen ligase